MRPRSAVNGLTRALVIVKTRPPDGCPQPSPRPTAAPDDGPTGCPPPSLRPTGRAPRLPPKAGPSRYARAVPTITEAAEIKDVIVVEPDRRGDERGLFIETYRRSWFPLGREMVQVNRAERKAGSVVGLHYHLHQADYWTVPVGRAWVVLHDLRHGSPTDGATFSIEVTADNALGLFIPPGVAHGFASITDMTISYMVDAYYNPADELGVAWDDPEVAADWGISEPVLSQRDQHNPHRADLDPGRLPYVGLRT